MNAIVKKVLIVTLGLSIVGCAATKRQESILESSGSKPAWVTTDKETETREGKVYFRAVVDRQRSLDMAMSRARAQAIGKVAEQVVLNVNTAFAETNLGTSNDIDDPSAGDSGSALQREIAMIANARKVTGIAGEATYWEKYLTTLSNGEEVIAYKVHSLVSVPQKALQQAQLRALEDGLSLAKQKRNDQAAATLSESLNMLKQEMGK